jgi:NAD(P)H-flavin reductase
MLTWPLRIIPSCFAELEVGDEIELKGPLGSFEWLGKGVANWRGVKRKTRNIGMICGGSGPSSFSSSDLEQWPAN